MIGHRDALSADGEDAVAVLDLQCRMEQGHRRRADEAGNEDVVGVVVEILRGGDLLQLAQAHDRYPMPHGHGLDLVVRHVYRRDAELLLQRGDLGAHLDAKLRIEIRQRLVHQEDLGIAHDGATHGNALSLSARELLGLAIEHGGQIEQLRRPLDLLGDFRLRHLAQRQAEADVLAHGHVRIERVALEHHGNVAITRRQIIDHAIPDEQFPICDLLETGDHPQGRGLAAAGRAHQHEELAVLNIDAEVLHGVEAVVVDLVDVLEDQFSHCRCPSFVVWFREAWWSCQPPDTGTRGGNVDDRVAGGDLSRVSEHSLE